MADSARTAAALALPDRICFLGFGLIGGSIALALRDAGSTAHLVAWTPTGNGPTEGLRRGLLDSAAATESEALVGAGLVVLAGPPLAILDTLRLLGGPLGPAIDPGATITDVASTKAMVVATAGRLGLPFVSGHPMAGRETSGVGSATADLFVGRPWVIVATDEADSKHLDRVTALATAVGARPMRMAPTDHDATVAAISHLPLIAAAALVESVASDAAGWARARPLAATGWRDMTRLARGDVEMGAGIVATNAAAIADQLRAYRGVIDNWLAELDRIAGSTDAASVGWVRERLAAARASLEQEA